MSDFDYPLPEDLIATEPAKERDASRLMVLHRPDGRIEHGYFRDIVEHLNGDDLLVLNDTKVLKARLLGFRETGGEAEALILRILGEDRCLTLIGTRGKVRPGEFFVFADGSLRLRTLEKDGAGRWTVSVEGDVERALDEFGLVPLPPYITKKRGTRQTTKEDEEAYQTVYATKEGSAAAPTAGLHFTKELLGTLKEKGVEIVTVTLHIGYDTFRPIKTENVEEHKMYSEFYEVDEQVVKTILEAHEMGKRIVAVGTTTVRVLETLAREQRPSGWTDLFIYPPFEFLLVDVLVTNFHLPRSSLLLLVSAFVGRETLLSAYSEAVRKRYRFYSFGDAMLII